MALLTFLAHPYRGSFAHAVAAALTETAGNKLVDLYEEHFDPILTARELRDYLEDVSPDEDVLAMQKRIEDATALAIVFPVWWGGPPAIMKGFFDRVLLPPWAFTIEEDGSITGNLTWLREIHVWCSLDAPDADYTTRTVTSMRQILWETTLSFCGVDVDRIVSHVLPSISTTSDEERSAWLDTARETGRRLSE